MFLAVSLEPLITKPRQPVFMGQNYRTDLAGIHGIHQRQKPLARKIHPSANLFDKLHVGKAACEAEQFRRHPLGSSGPIVGFDYSPGLDVHPEQAGDFMAGKCAVHDLYSYPFRHR